MSGECFHGGAFWDAIGVDFGGLQRRHDVVSADVLDAWFPPSPQVVSALIECGDWLYRTSPPTHAAGLVQAISRIQNLPFEGILAGPGSSALLYLALGKWLRPRSRVVLIEPSYGEYAHFCSHVVPCDVRFTIVKADIGFALDLDQWLNDLRDHSADLAVMVRPNNPTGVGTPLPQLHSAFQRVPLSTRVLIDEAYIDYTNLDSAESILCEFPNVFVLKSLSKCFALSGLRAAYLAGAADEIAAISRKAPPWWVSLPAQIAAVRALSSENYYQERYAQTEELRLRMARDVGLAHVGAANWLLMQLPEGVLSSEVIDWAREEGVYMRDAGRSAPSLGTRWIRCAVRSRDENDRVVQVLRKAFATLPR